MVVRPHFQMRLVTQASLVIGDDELAFARRRFYYEQYALAAYLLGLGNRARVDFRYFSLRTTTPIHLI